MAIHGRNREGKHKHNSSLHVLTRARATQALVLLTSARITGVCAILICIITLEFKKSRPFTKRTQDWKNYERAQGTHYGSSPSALDSEFNVCLVLMNRSHLLAYEWLVLMYSEVPLVCWLEESLLVARLKEPLSFFLSHLGRWA
jgi:hypothetical protein